MTNHTGASSKGNTSNPRATIGDNSKAVDAAAGGIQKVTPGTVELWGPAREQAEDYPREVIDETIALIVAGHQRSAVPVRPVTGGGFEAVAKGHIVVAARRHNEEHPTNPVTIDVRVLSDRSDEHACRLLALDVEQDHQPSSLARGRFFMSAVETFGNLKKAADGCRVSQATVSKNLDVVRCLVHVADKVETLRDISQRDASWLMQMVGREEGVGKAPDPEMRTRVLDAITAAKRQPAAGLFKHLRKAARGSEVKVPRNRHPLTHDGVEFGYIKVEKGEPVRIELTRALELQPAEIGAAIVNLIAKMRS